MEATVRRQLPVVIEQLVRSPQRYQFFSALRLLEHAGFIAHSKFHPSVELAFPAADIKQLTIDEQDRFCFELGFLGLYGVDSPLPLYLNQAAVAEHAPVLRGLLDMLSHHCYQLLYLAWQRSHVFINADRQLGFAKLPLRSLTQQVLPDEVNVAHTYIGGFFKRARSSYGLQIMLMHYLKTSAVTVKTNQPRWLTLPQRLALGVNIKLADNSLLGERCLDASGRLDIVIGPLNLPCARALLSNQGQQQQLKQLVKRYLGSAIEFSIQITIHVHAANALRLGEPRLVLGEVVYLGQITTAMHAVVLSCCFIDSR